MRLVKIPDKGVNGKNGNKMEIVRGYGGEM